MTNNSDTSQQVTFFATQEDFRAWLELNHETANELIVGFYKVKSGKPSMTWSQSVDQALCFGWIDSIRKTIDSESYSIRFTPRRSNSIWSQINIDKIEELTKAGLMKPAGIKAFNLKKEDKSGIYSYENDALTAGSAFEIQLKTNPVAWEFFLKQAPSYRKAVIHWIMSAKQEATRIQRLDKLLQACSTQKKL